LPIQARLERGKTIFSYAPSVPDIGAWFDFNTKPSVVFTRQHLLTSKLAVMVKQAPSAFVLPFLFVRLALRLFPFCLLVAQNSLDALYPLYRSILNSKIDIRLAVVWL
jgi:hypothetical protein